MRITFFASAILVASLLLPDSHFIKITSISSPQVSATTNFISTVFSTEIDTIDAINLHPNPVRTRLYVEGGPGDLEKVQIVSMIGGELPVRTSDQSIDVSHLPAGPYFLRIPINSDQYQTIKFIKR